MGYSILSTVLLSSALHRLHSVISDFRPPCVLESGEAALRRLLASRAIGGYSLTSDDSAPGSLTVFQSSRVAPPQDASEALYFVSLLSSSARLFLVSFCSVNFVLFLRFLQAAVEHVGLFFVAKKAGAQRCNIDARASNRHFLNPLSGPLLTEEGLCHVEFQGAPEDARIWFVVSVDNKNAFPGCKLLFFPVAAFLASEVGYTGKKVDQKRLAPVSLIYLVPHHFQLAT